MFVYRVEHKETRHGPYCTDLQPPDGVGRLLVETHTNPATHPIEYELLDPSMAAWRYGFESLYLLERWFEGFLDLLHEEGFRVMQYEVPQRYVRHGTRQLRFDPDQAEFLGPVYVEQ